MRHPTPEVTNKFSRFEDDYVADSVEQLERDGAPLPVYQNFYGPVEVGDQCRALMYHGRRALGWFGLYRRGGAEAFTITERDELNKHAGGIQSGLAALDFFDPAATIDQAQYVVLSSTLSLTWATTWATTWLTSARLESIRAWVARGEEDAIAIDGISLLRVAMSLEGHGQEWLIVIEPYDPIECSPLSFLSTMQRQIVAMVQNGHSCVHIAQQMGLTDAQVKAQLIALQRHFAVDSTWELTRQLSATG